jgi:hypothetical protein
MAGPSLKIKLKNLTNHLPFSTDGEVLELSEQESRVDVLVVVNSHFWFKGEHETLGSTEISLRVLSEDLIDESTEHLVILSLDE